MFRYRSNFGAPWQGLTPLLSHQRRTPGRASASNDLTLLCPGWTVPPYVRLKLTDQQRSALVRHRLSYEAKVQAPLSRPLRIFFENGLEIRIAPYPDIEISAIYHVHPWLLGVTPRPSRLNLDVPALFERTEEILISSRHSWSDASDPRVSRHLCLSNFEARQNADGEEDVLDGSGTSLIYIMAPETLIAIHRSGGRGLDWSVHKIGSDAYDAGDRPGYKPTSAVTGELAVLEAVTQARRAIASLPYPRRVLLVWATQLGTMFSLKDIARTHLRDAIFGFLKRRRR